MKRPRPTLRLARQAMRTRFEALLTGELPLPDLRAAGEAALDEIERASQQLNAWQPGCELHYVNARASQEAVRVEPRLFAFLQRAGELHALSGGAFDPCVGPLLDVWQIKQGGLPAEPTPEERAAARELTGYSRQVQLDAETCSVRFARPGVWIDPGALGKGYALDRAAQILRDCGIRDALLHGGTSSILALGTDPLAQPWRIALPLPSVDASSGPRTVTLTDGRALGISGAFGRQAEVGGLPRGHVLDPRSGEPVERILFAAVCAPSAAEADAYSTALLVTADPASLPPGCEALL